MQSVVAPSVEEIIQYGICHRKDPPLVRSYYYT